MTPLWSSCQIIAVQMLPNLSSQHRNQHYISYSFHSSYPTISNISELACSLTKEGYFHRICLSSFCNFLASKHVELSVPITPSSSLFFFLLILFSFCNIFSVSRFDVKDFHSYYFMSGRFSGWKVDYKCFKIQ